MKLVTRSSLLVTFFLALVLLLCWGEFSFAANDINVTAELSRNRVMAGDVVQLDVKVSGTQQADLPREITVDGLQIRLAGQSTQVQMVNFSVSSSTLYSYIVVPLQSGTFVIPAIQVRAEGRYFKTAPLQLTVVGKGTTPSATAPPLSPTTNFASSRTQNATRSSSRPATNQIAFGEISLPKNKLYAGEVVPVEIRFYFDIHYGIQVRGGLNFGGEGFLADRFNDPDQTQTERGGNRYNVLTFRSLISAVKPGHLELPPASLNLIVEMPEEAPPGIDDDLFSQVLRRHGASMTKQKELTVKTNPQQLEILPLPKEGRPADFSGAIGQFYLDDLVLPKKYILGDPVTLSIKVEGKGNFKAMSAPQLTATDGWRSYPPTERFDPSDGIGWRGVKTFETTMIAQKPLTTTPGTLFSYFDPESTKYVTLTTKPLPLEIIGQATPSAAGSTNNAATATPSPTPAASHELSKVYQPLTHRSVHSWQASLFRKEFLIASCTLFLSLLLFMLYLAIQQQQQSVHALREQQFKKLWRELQDETVEPLSFYHKAAKYAEGLHEKGKISQEALDVILTRCDEINYGARENFLSHEERHKILKQLS